LLFQEIPAWKALGIKFNLTQAEALPENGVPEGLSTVVDEEAPDLSNDEGPAQEGVESSENDTYVFIEHNGPVDQDAAIRNAIWPEADEHNLPQSPMAFPLRDERPLNEFEQNDIFSLVFPTLFPLGILPTSYVI
jgi:hypothetical protein